MELLTLKEFQKKTLLRVLKENNYNTIKTSNSLGITMNQLYNLISRKHNISLSALKKLK